LERLYNEDVVQLDYKSCEMIADDLAVTIQDKYPDRYIKISVAEDNENGCEMEYPVNYMDGPSFEDTDAIADVFDSLK
jgi:tRNA isopentenyl-2-thiomethyl-A-37 hydroxylase MiaE